MKALVIYRSRTGFTQRYAEWIAEALHCEATPWKMAAGMDLSGYDTLVYGGGLCAGMISGLKAFLKLTDDKILRRVVFVTGASPADSPDVAKSIEQNLTGVQRGEIATFYFQSGLCYEKMGLAARLMMKVFRSMVRKQAGEDSDMYRMVSSSYDLCSKEAIEPLVAYCQNTADS